MLQTQMSNVEQKVDRVETKLDSVILKLDAISIVQTEIDSLKTAQKELEQKYTDLKDSKGNEKWLIRVGLTVSVVLNLFALFKVTGG